MNKDISFAQLGRRYDYKYAEIISKFGYLNKLYTDFWTPFNLKGNKLFSNKLFHRNNINIPFNKIQSYNILGLKLKYDL